MRERKSNMLGDIVRMEAVNAGQNIGAVSYIDQDDFYPASGIAVDERGDIDTIDMVYDHSKNDMSPTADYFDGDYANSYADGDDDDFDNFDDDDFDNFDDEDYDDFDDDEDDFDGDDDYEDFDDDEDDFDGDDDYEDFDDEDYDDFDDEDYDDFDDEDEDDFDGDDDYDNFDDVNTYDTEAEWGEFEGEDDIDMEESMGDYNDLSSGGFDFFEGGDPELDTDYNNFDSDTYSEARGRRRRKKGRRSAGATAEKIFSYTPLGMAKRAMDNRYSEEGQERAEKRRESREKRRADRREGRRSKREERQTERKDRREQRQSLRAQKKLSKIEETNARSEATKALANQPAEDPAVTQMMQNLNTKSAPVTPEKKGLSTGAIVGISLGALALVGGAIFLILRKK
jgi:hypothetical protein